MIIFLILTLEPNIPAVSEGVITVIKWKHFVSQQWTEC